MKLVLPLFRVNNRQVTELGDMNLKNPTASTAKVEKYKFDYVQQSSMLFKLNFTILNDTAALSQMESKEVQSKLQALPGFSAVQSFDFLFDFLCFCRRPKRLHSQKFLFIYFITVSRNSTCFQICSQSFFWGKKLEQSL